MNANDIMAALHTYDEAQDIIEQAAREHAAAAMDIVTAHPNWEALSKHRLWGDLKATRKYPLSRWDTFQYAELSNGKIDCQFEDRDGDTFYIRLPVTVLHAFCEDDKDTLAHAAQEVAQEYITVLTVRQVQADADRESKERAEYERLAAKYRS